MIRKDIRNNEKLLQFINYEYYINIINVNEISLYHSLTTINPNGIKNKRDKVEFKMKRCNYNQFSICPFNFPFFEK